MTERGVQMIRRLIEWLSGRRYTHTNPYSPHIRKMMELERQDREQPWLKYRY